MFLDGHGYAGFVQPQPLTRLFGPLHECTIHVQDAVYCTYTRCRACALPVCPMPSTSAASASTQSYRTSCLAPDPPHRLSNRQQVDANSFLRELHLETVCHQLLQAGPEPTKLRSMMHAPLLPKRCRWPSLWLKRCRWPSLWLNLCKRPSL